MEEVERQIDVYGAEFIDAIQNNSFHILQQRESAKLKEGSSPRGRTSARRRSAGAPSAGASGRTSSKRDMCPPDAVDSPCESASTEQSQEARPVREVRATVSFARKQTARQPVSVVLVKADVDRMRV